MTEKSNAATESEIPELKPLYPQYDESSHASYVQKLEKALKGTDNKIHNIALSGVYGSGKAASLRKSLKTLRKSALIRLEQSHWRLWLHSLRSRMIGRSIPSQMKVIPLRKDPALPQNLPNLHP